jgi:predicted metal-dependent enzyme (double-stranded beta helix superfamily)
MYNNINKVVVASNKLMKYICKNNPTYYNTTKLRALSFILNEYYKTNKFDWSKYVNVSDMNKYGYYKHNIKYNTNNTHLSINDITCNIITWAPGAETKLHGHPNISCIMMPINGSLNQIIAYNNSDIPSYLLLDKDKDNKKYVNKVLCQGQISYIDDSIGLHKIYNESDNYTVSLHIYKYIDNVDTTLY